MTTTSTYEPPTYSAGRRPASPGIWGLGLIGTVVLLGGGIATVITMRAAGVQYALIPVGIVALFLGLLLRKDRRFGRTGLQRIGVRLGHRRAARTGANLLRTTFHGRHHLPGLAAGSQLTEHRDSWDTPFALLTYPATGDHAVAFCSEPDGSALVDPEQVDLWVAKWGGWLAMLGDEPGLVGAQVVIETAPDSGTRLRREVETHTDPQAPDFAQATMREIVDTYPVGSATVKAWVVLTFSAWLREDSKRRSTSEVARDLAIRLPGLRQGLAEAGAGAPWPATAQDWCEELLTAFDPVQARKLDAARAAGETIPLSWDQVGPVAHEAMWSRYRHDSGTSVTWEMGEAPRGDFPSSILAHLLDAHPDVDRKRVAMLYRPLSSADAARVVEKDKASAQTRLRGATTKHKEAPERLQAALDAAKKAAREEARGAGLVNYSAVVTATFLDPRKEPDAVAAVDNLAATARIGLRVVAGSQDSAFAFGLPLGLVPTRHLAVPAQIRENL